MSETVSEKSKFTLIEIAQQFQQNIYWAVDHGATGNLAICAVAEEWQTTLEAQETDAEREKPFKSPDKKMILDGQLVELVPKDLLKASNKDHVWVRDVKINSGSCARLDPPVEIHFGALYVTREERDRFAKQMGFILDKSQGGILLEPTPPYLDKSNPNFSGDLKAAVDVWLALYRNGGFNPRHGHKDQILKWLGTNYPNLTSNARERIATIVNANKKGGAPRTE